MLMKLSEYVANRLAAYRAKHVFVVSGAGNAHLLDSIAYHPELKYVCPHHEQAGLMAAVAYARLTDRPGVMLVTAGPGAANAIIGVLNAWADSVPCLILSGQEKSIHATAANPLRMWGVQGFDVVKTVSGMTKYAALVDRPESIRYHLEKALYLASAGRPGPVWLDLPVDVQSARIDPDLLEGYTPPAKEPSALEAAVAQVRAYLAQAQRPVIWLGNGIRIAGASALVAPLLQRYPAAYLTAWNGADLLATDEPLHFGHAGVYGQRCANFVLQNCDLLLAIGTRLAIPQVGYEASEFARGATRIMVDIDPTEIAKLASLLHLGIEADAGDFLRALLDEPREPASSLSHLAGALAEPTAWLKQCNAWRKKYPIIEAGTHDHEPGYINSYRFIDKLSDHFSADETVVLDAGTACTCSFQALRLKLGQRVVYSTGLGEMGFGLPGAIGASFARGKGRVILISGDGSFLMNLQEMQTAIHHRLPLKIFLFTNGSYLSIKHTQKAIFGRLAGADPESGVTCPDFGKVAAAFGFRTATLCDWENADAILEDVLSGPEPVLCEVPMHPMQLLVPKLALAITAEGQMVSPPLEDLSPLLGREPLREEMMLVGMHPKSQKL
ncbi:thiamine pyrophosphate-binding protein [Bryobacter aggregatus]|uniref:thiamine pyrophosphate-binding protein n=1 Tax=Bryobacter aggregatus TaxID=360054 RepID=UPI000566D55F|nr:thiamine pyrophosphate-binding protein [Bryobacter aggregatus]